MMKCTVLVIEDHVASGRALCDLLGQLGHRGVHVTAADGLAKLRSRKTLTSCSPTSPCRAGTGSGSWGVSPPGISRCRWS